MNDVKCVALLGASYIYDISGLRVNLFCQTPLNVPEMFIVHHQEVFTVCVQLTSCWPGQDGTSSILTRPAATTFRALQSLSRPISVLKKQLTDQLTHCF
jgi:hypothetical protein